MTFQTKIYKPDGTALTSPIVDFRFTTVAPTGTCILYVEDFNNQDLSNLTGLAVFNLGNGIKVYPAVPYNFSSAFNNLQSSFTCQGGGTYSPGVATTARELGIKVFAVDGRDQNTKPDSQNFSNYIRSSNSFIRKNVKTLFDSETCSSGLMVVGKAHIEHPQIQISIKDSLKTLFENSQIPTLAVNLVYTGENVYSDNHDQQWKWNICDETPKPLKKQMVIKRDRLNSENGNVIYPVNTYDFYLFLPEVESSRLYQ